MPGIRPFSADLNNTHCLAALAVGDSLSLKAQDATSSASVSLNEANGVSYAGATTSGTTRLDVGPFAAKVVLQISATGNVRVETNVAGVSVTT